LRWLFDRLDRFDMSTRSCHDSFPERLR
jgi:hypothetical protein